MSKILYAIHIDCFKAFNEALEKESDRARVILIAAWIDHFLNVKFKNEFSKGNAKARKDLFSLNGPFATFSAKLNAAFCAGWIDNDVYHDVQIIRKLRNECAHTVESITLNDERVRKYLGSFRVPHREYHDWGKVRAASIENGAILYKGEKPDHAGENLYIPGGLTLRIAISIIISVLVANLDIPFATDEEDCIAKVRLPKHMEKAQRIRIDRGSFHSHNLSLFVSFGIHRANAYI